MTTGDARSLEVLEDLKAKIRTVIERVGVTDMAVEIIIDLVARGLGRLGGRPPNGLGTRSKRVPKPRESAISGDLFSSPVSPENPENSKQTPEDKGNIMEAQQVNAAEFVAALQAESPYGKALRCFCEIWRTRYGVWYEASASDRNQLGRLLKDLTPDQLIELPRAFRGYLGDLSPFVAQEQRHSLRFFCTSGGFNKYRTTAPVVSTREAMNIEAGRQFVNGEGNHARPRR